MDTCARFHSVNHENKKANMSSLDNLIISAQSAQKSANSLVAKLTNDQFGMMQELAKKFDMALVSNAEHANLIKKSKQTAEDIEKLVAERLDVKVKELNGELSHRVEIQSLTGKADLEILKARIKLLENVDTLVEVPTLPADELV